MADLDPVQIISGVFGPEPAHGGYQGTTFVVGREHELSGVVTSIVYRLQDLGDRGIQWLDVWCGDQRVASLNASHVAEIRYQDNRNT